MNTYIFMLVWLFNGTPLVVFQEVTSLDTCKSFELEMTRMVKKAIQISNNYNDDDADNSFKTFCHSKELK